jgi:hypothetical protein
MSNVKITEQNSKQDFIEVFAETTLENGESVEKRFKFKKWQIDEGIYRDVLKSWASEVHEDYIEDGELEGEEIEF